MKKESKSRALGHIAAFICAIIWGTTFVSTKVVLLSFSAVDILVIRFILGYLFLWVLYPKKLPFQGVRSELNLALAGLFGIGLYYLAENLALEYSSASNVSTIVSTAPFFIAIVFKLFKESTERLTKYFFIGFLSSLVGIIIMNLNGTALNFHYKGDLLALLGSVVWGLYSVFIKRVSNKEINTISLTRRVFFYGLIFLIPLGSLMGFNFNISSFFDYKNSLNILYLGFGASAICFAIWNFAIKELGALISGIYIYLIPAITVLFSAIFLKESITVYILIGISLVIIGLFISDK